MKNAFIIHGVGGHREENWFPWLQHQLAVNDFEVHIPQFPTPDGQTLENWLEVLEDYSEYINSNTLFIAHSLGVPFTLNVLERHTLAAAYLVAGFTGKAGNEFDPGMATFAQREFNWDIIKDNCSKFTVIHSDNDPYIDISKADELADHLDTDVVVFPGAGHFNEAAGYTQFPELLDHILAEQ